MAAPGAYAAASAGAPGGGDPAGNGTVVAHDTCASTPSAQGAVAAVGQQGKSTKKPPDDDHGDDDDGDDYDDDDWGDEYWEEEGEEERPSNGTSASHSHPSKVTSALTPFSLTNSERKTRGHESSLRKRFPSPPTKVGRSLKRRSGKLIPSKFPMSTPPTVSQNGLVSYTRLSSPVHTTTRTAHSSGSLRFLRRPLKSLLIRETTQVSTPSWRPRYAPP